MSTTATKKQPSRTGKGSKSKASKTASAKSKMASAKTANKKGGKRLSPGALDGLQLVVGDLDAARAELVARGLDLSEPRTLGREGHPGFRFAFFTDPDGNGWAIQEIRT